MTLKTVEKMATATLRALSPLLTSSTSMKRKATTKKSETTDAANTSSLGRTKSSQNALLGSATKGCLRRYSEERSDEVRRHVPRMLTYAADTSVRDVAAANSTVACNFTNTTSFATRFARRSSST